MTSQIPAADKHPSLETLASQLATFVHQAAQQGKALHEVEPEIWQRALQFLRAGLGMFFETLGSGDVGETFTLPEGPMVQRLPTLHPRAVTTIGGTFTLQRTVYGTREGQAIQFVPLDQQLALPAGKFSYLVQDWSQWFCCETPFGQVQGGLERIFGLTLPVDSLERANQRLAQLTEAFRDQQPTPPAAEEGELLVRSGDGKGVPMRRPADAAPIQNHQRRCGPKKDRKRMATVGTVYSVDRHRRTPEEVLEALFRDPKETTALAVVPDRPVPCHKRVWACLDHVDAQGEERAGRPEVFAWMAAQLTQRNPQGAKTVVNVMDGQEALWEALEIFGRCEDRFGRVREVDVLDLLHVTPRVWEVAHLFHRAQSPEAVAFVRNSVGRILHGTIAGVLRSWRRLARVRGLSAAARAKLAKIIAYLRKNQSRMHYDQYLAAGYPIASGVIEGACRHVVKDRMEQTGMSWRKPGAQAMLDTRTTRLNGDWEDYTTYRIARETARLYPHRETSGRLPFALAL
jgi:hypothetical protein